MGEASAELSLKLARHLYGMNAHKYLIIGRRDVAVRCMIYDTDLR